MAKLVDAGDSKSPAIRHVGSSPTLGTKISNTIIKDFLNGNFTMHKNKQFYDNKNKLRILKRIHQQLIINENLSFQGLLKLGLLMSFLSGSINSFGFLLISEYNSHMTGHLSQITKSILDKELEFCFYQIILVISFILGALHSSFIIIWTKTKGFKSSFGISFCLESIYILICGILGYNLQNYESLFQITSYFISFILGMHNAVITILSSGTVRSTHMTGFITDLGIELSKIFSRNRDHKPNLPKIKLYLGLIVTFIIGGVLGGLLFLKLEYYFVLPISLILFFLGFSTIRYDINMNKLIRN